LRRGHPLVTPLLRGDACSRGDSRERQGSRAGAQSGLATPTCTDAR